MVLVATMRVGVGGVSSDLGWRGSDALSWGQSHFMSVVPASLSSEPPLSLSEVSWFGRHMISLGGIVGGRAQGSCV